MLYKGNFRCLFSDLHKSPKLTLWAKWRMLKELSLETHKSLAGNIRANCSLLFLIETQNFFQIEKF